MKYAFLGAGKMASAIIQGMLSSKECVASDIIAACPEPELLANLSKTTSVRGVASNEEAAEAGSIVILCVKPADVAEALEQAGSGLEGKLLISIVAGLPIEALKELAPNSRIIRAMPNAAAMVGYSATAFSADEDTTDDDLSVAASVFSCIGKVYPVQEKMLNAVTGLSGSGPAYIFLVLEALSDGGVAAGLPRKLSLDLAVQTLFGAAEMVAATSQHPAILREMVTSPAGTTIAGLAELENRAVRSAFIEAVCVATGRAQDLSGS